MIHKIPEFFKQLVWVLFFSLVAGIVLGILIVVGFLFFVRHPFSAIGFAGVFSFFHIGDLKRFIAERNWYGLFLRPVYLLALSSSIAGFVYLAFYPEISTTEIQIGGCLIGLTVFVVLVYQILKSFFGSSKLFKSIDGVVTGAEILEIF